MHTGEIWKGRVTQISELAQINKVNVLSRMEWLDKELIDREFIAGGYYTVADITAQCAFVMAKAAVDNSYSGRIDKFERLVGASFVKANCQGRRLL